MYKNILPLASELMLFQVLSTDGTGSDVLGGAVSANNAAFLAVEELLGTDAYPAPAKITDLSLHGSVKARFSLSGTSGTYRIVRVK